MSKVSTELNANAINNASIILKEINSCNQSKVAEGLGIDGSSLSRMKNDKKSNGLTDVELFAGLLTAIGLKIVPACDVYCSPEVAEATRVYLAHAFTSPEYMRILFR